MAGQNPLDDPLGHAIDTDSIHLPGGEEFPLFEWSRDSYDALLQFLGISGLTKFMMLEVIAALGCLVIFIPFAWSIRRRGVAVGVVPNLLETMLFFIRDQIAIPAIGEHDARRYLPYLWSVFFFILFNNLLGMVPIVGGSPTGALGCTFALATCSFLAIHGSGVLKFGPGGYVHSIVPHVPVLLYPLMFVLEIIGHLIKPTILGIRLFMNMLAGHTVLFVILAFIAMVGEGLAYFVVTPASVMGVVALSLLEIFVAFLQAYVFTYLSAIFIGSALHPSH
jgi:F-type H+-transporting ATPase subunit a